ncbi:MAG: purine-binding chemotaxis protein CheW [Planctomycetota bacterium]|jgi:purine-binding chemotaxis protein CheW
MSQVIENNQVEHVLAGKYLSFMLGGEEYGVRILKVREIIAFQDVTPLPRMPEFIKGVLNLRGRIVPVIDLRMKLGVSCPDITPHSCIVVLEVEAAGDSETLAQIGCIVDTVSEVLDINSEHMAPAPRFTGSLNTSFILGLGKIPNKEKVVALLDIDQILSSAEVIELALQVAEEDPALFAE